MDRSKQIAAMAESNEERMLLIRVCDRLERALEREIPGSSTFLSPREQALVRQLLPQCRFFGGIEGADRAVAYVLPEYLTEEDFFEEGPIACLRAEFYEENALSHRDVLGALMGAGIRRDAVGDICLQEKSCDIFVQRELVRYLLDNLISAGRHHLHLSEIPLKEARRLPPKMKQVRATVSSARLDGVVSAVFHISRGAATEAIAAGKVALNSLTCLKGDKPVAEGDEISLRGRGKARIEEVGRMTKKGRIALTAGIFV